MSELDRATAINLTFRYENVPLNISMGAQRAGIVCAPVGCQLCLGGCPARRQQTQLGCHLPGLGGFCHSAPHQPGSACSDQGTALLTYLDHDCSCAAYNVWASLSCQSKPVQLCPPKAFKASQFHHLKSFEFVPPSSFYSYTWFITRSSIVSKSRLGIENMWDCENEQSLQHHARDVPQISPIFAGLFISHCLRPKQDRQLCSAGILNGGHRDEYDQLGHTRKARYSPPVGC